MADVEEMPSKLKISLKAAFTVAVAVGACLWSLYTVYAADQSRQNKRINNNKTKVMMDYQNEEYQEQRIRKLEDLLEMQSRWNAQVGANNLPSPAEVPGEIAPGDYNQ